MRLRRKDILELVEEGENLHTEFKLKFSSAEKIAKEMMAFANTSGGYLLFGVDDSKRIAGVASEKGETELIQMAVRDFCEPIVDFEIMYFDIEGKEVVVVFVPESGRKPHRIQDYKNTLDITTAQVYVRVNDKSVQAGKEMIRILKSEENRTGLTKYTIGAHEKMVFEHLEKYESITVKDLIAKANVSERRASRTLVKLVRAGSLLIHTRENGENYFTAR
jgi:predicted HTH transcriptional regulator